MVLLLSSLAVLTLASLAILLSARCKIISGHIFLGSLVIGCGLGLLSALEILCKPALAWDFRAHWQIPLGTFHIGMDVLSAFFLLLVFLLALAAGIYGYGYLREYGGQRNIGVHFALYHLLIMAIALILVAKGVFIFLVAWELMTFVSYFLVTFYNEKETVQRAGYIYLIATHSATFCLLGMFLLMGAQAGSLDFDVMRATQFPLGSAALIFLLALVGFGAKAGMIPLHIWLPYAHPAAPTHISALLSGVVIKIGIYGLMRIIAIIHDLPLWCGIFLLALAVISGVGGVLYALGQHEVKKLLAYHSIENIGIILLGLGVGLTGHIYQQESVAFIGYAGALLHTFNHALFKGLLFLSAGSVIRSTHTGSLDDMGGLIKALPWTGGLFLIGSFSICGLPLFNGFISEWLVYRAILEGVFRLDIYGVIFSSLAIVALALIGGLAALCFTKAFGAIFLGKSRAAKEYHCAEPGWLLRGPMLALAAICFWGGLFPAVMVFYALEAAQAITGVVIPYDMLAAVIAPLFLVTKILMISALIFIILALLRKLALQAYPVRQGETWTCGYAYPSARMQYTASSFAASIINFFKSILLFKVELTDTRKYYPAPAHLSSSVKDASEYLVFRPLFYGIKKISWKLKWIQSGHTQSYILYVLSFLLILLIWKLG